MARSTKTRVHEFWVRTQKIVMDREGQPQVKDTTCCCKAPGALRRVCARAQGNKTPCRCACHSKCFCGYAKCRCGAVRGAKAKRLVYLEPRSGGGEGAAT